MKNVEITKDQIAEAKEIIGEGFEQGLDPNKIKVKLLDTGLKFSIVTKIYNAIIKENPEIKPKKEVKQRERPARVRRRRSCLRS